MLRGDFRERSSGRFSNATLKAFPQRPSGVFSAENPRKFPEETLGGNPKGNSRDLLIIFVGTFEVNPGGTPGEISKVTYVCISEVAPGRTSEESLGLYIE